MIAIRRTIWRYREAKLNQALLKYHLVYFISKLLSTRILLIVLREERNTYPDAKNRNSGKHIRYSVAILTRDTHGTAIEG